MNPTMVRAPAPQASSAAIAAGPARYVVLLAVLVCAACGLVYELALAALGGTLGGDPVVATSIVLSVMVFAMGVGALAAKPLARRAAAAFIAAEILLAACGGMCVTVLYAGFAWYDVYRWPMIAVAAVLGLLIGAEIPLLMTLVQRIRPQEAGSAVADLFAADYVGALIGGLLFPFLLLPRLGQLRTVVLTGVVNAVAGALVVLWLFRADLSGRVRIGMYAAVGAVLALLAGTWSYTPAFERAARDALYGGGVVSARDDVVVTHTSTGPELYVDGERRVPASGAGESAQALVHPAMAGRHERVLVLGGGDGLALREVLRYAAVREVVVVVARAAETEPARVDPALRALAGDAFADGRVRVVVGDAFAWVRAARDRFDVVVADLPAPTTGPAARLYTQEFYGLTRAVLRPAGRIVVHAPVPDARRAYWCVDAGLRAAGLHTVPYRVTVPGPADRGYVLAGVAPEPGLRAADDAPDQAAVPFLTADRLALATWFPPNQSRVDVPPSTLARPRIADYAR
ncbi:polyamine aminopropyltransferase [Embleya sp. NBC_00896]|uniref:polyamine aminopropyltransferase n=1 Tax=Embleya sp. NBC_00896 TaxID=2975961 RepID=UPI0038680C88|nr:polyamine aminopropyltransferase [Embleya sp. NBC_00896]